MNRRSLFKVLGGAIGLTLASSVVNKAVAAVAPKAVESSLGDWLELDGGVIPIKEVEEFAKVFPSWVKDGCVVLPNMPATAMDVHHVSVPQNSAHSHTLTIAELPSHSHHFHAYAAATVQCQRQLPMRYMVKVRQTDGPPMGSIMLFAK